MNSRLSKHGTLELTKMPQRYRLRVVGLNTRPTNSVKTLTSDRAKAILTPFLPHLSIVATAARYAVSMWTLIVVAYHIYCNLKKNKESGSMTTITSPVKPRQTAEANDSKELFPKGGGITSTCTYLADRLWSRTSRGKVVS